MANRDGADADERWTLHASDRALLGNKAGATRLGFTVLLKMFQADGRFPHRLEEVPLAAVEVIARQVDVPAAAWRSVVHRHEEAWCNGLLTRLPETPAGIDALLKAPPSDATGDKDSHVPIDRGDRGLVARCRATGTVHVRRPATGPADAPVRTPGFPASARERRYRPAWPRESRGRRGSVLGDTQRSGCASRSCAPLLALRAGAGQASLQSVGEEAAKLACIRALALPADLFADLPSKVLLAYRRRVAAEELHELRRHPAAIRLTLLAAFCHVRGREITDALVDLLIATVHRIGVKAEKQVESELIADLKRVAGKPALLFKLAAASLARPNDPVRDVVFPVVDEQTLRELVAEGEATGPLYRHHLQAVIRSSYRSHYRRMLPVVLDALTFRSNNQDHRSVLDALALVRRHAGSKLHCYPPEESVPLDGVVPIAWRNAVIERDAQGRPRVNRITYEQLRCKEIWVEGADRYRNPDEDLPADFEARRDEHYTALGLPRDADAFIVRVRAEMVEALATFDRGLAANPYVRILKRGGGRIALTPLEKQEDPAGLVALKTEIGRRWPMTSLLDMLKEADLRIGFTDAFRTVTDHENLSRATLQERLLLCLNGIGIWGEGTTACAADSKQFGAWDQNLMTEWHVRYGGRGVMIYWHVERRSTCIYSQLKTPSSSEVAAMIEGVLRHCTEMEVEKTYVDSHGQSDVGFAFCHLLGFQLLPRLKRIHAQRLYRPVAGESDAYPGVRLVLSRPIDWDLIRRQYNEMVKFATALRLGTAASADILRRFTRANLQHPTYKALVELGKALRTTFLSRYLHRMELRREVNEGLNVIESWNGANDFILYGRGGEIATNRLEEQEATMLALHLLQNCMVYVNMLMVQRVLGEPIWLERLGVTEQRALTPLFWSHVNPYGTFQLDMTVRLPLDPPPPGRAVDQLPLQGV
jgi:TnpA family transposase